MTSSADCDLVTNPRLCFRQGGGAGDDATDAGSISETGAASLVLYLLLYVYFYYHHYHHYYVRYSMAVSVVGGC